MFKNYFKIFFITYLIILATKFLFYIYLKENFSEYSISDILYTIFWGYKFDFATSSFIAFFATLFDFHQKYLKVFTVIFISILLLIQFSDIIYFQEASRHIGYEITDAFIDAKSLFFTALSQHTLLTVSALFITIFVAYFISKLSYQKVSIDKFYLPKKILLLILTIFFIRGMFQNIPLNPWQSNQIGDSKLANIALNDFYNVIFSLSTKNQKLKERQLPKIDNQTLIKSLKALYEDRETKSQDKELPIVQTKPNIILLFMESWSANFISAYSHKYNNTPVFDQLYKNSIHPKIMIAGGHRTTEGLFCTLVSFQNPLGRSVAKTNLQNNHWVSLIDLFKQRGYSSAFFQGTNKETSGTGSLAQNLGFEKSYGKSDVKERKYEPNSWGVQDPDLYAFVLEKLQSELKEPFIIGINGATTHDLVVPKEFEKDFVDDEKINKQLNVFHFSDWAMGEFIKRVEKLYPNTLFVIFADHCGGNLSGTLENYEIPFAIYSKKLIQPKEINITLSQRDIAPTIVDLALGDYKKLAPHFSGKSIFQDKIFFADYYANGILGWIEDDKILELNIATNQYKCYKMDGLHKQNIECNNSYKTLTEKALSFTTVSQKLLFKDKMLELKKQIGL